MLFKQLHSPLETSFDSLNTSFTEHIRKVEKMGNILTLEKQDSKEKLEALEKAGKAGYIPNLVLHALDINFTYRSCTWESSLLVIPARAGG